MITSKDQVIRKDVTHFAIQESTELQAQENLYLFKFLTTSQLHK